MSAPKIGLYGLRQIKKGLLWYIGSFEHKLLIHVVISTAFWVVSFFNPKLWISLINFWFQVNAILEWLFFGLFLYIRRVKSNFAYGSNSIFWVGFKVLKNIRIWIGINIFLGCANTFLKSCSSNYVFVLCRFSIQNFGSTLCIFVLKLYQNILSVNN
jgi:hypothetical protein